jgi:hypothetical protein
MLAAPLLEASPAALGWRLVSPQRQVPQEPAQQQMLERLAARASAQVAPPEHQPARLWQQEAWPPAPGSEQPQRSRQQRDAGVESASVEPRLALSNP